MRWASTKYFLASAAALIGLASVAGGCGGSDGDAAADGATTPGNDTTVSGGDGTTGVDGTTPPGDGVSGPDGSPPFTPSCTGDGDCPGAGEVCDCTGACVVPTSNGCNSGVNCLATEWCNPCSKHCEAVVHLCEACSTAGLCPDGVCASGDACAQQGACLTFADGNQYCTQACISNAGCPKGFLCTDVEGRKDKQCVPLSGDCRDLDLCTDDGECPDGQICNDALGQCAPGCAADESCAGGMVCVAARCQPPCGSNADCEAPKECVDGGRCKEPGACETSAECPDEETYCNKSTGKCVPGCLVDADCKDAGKICEGGSCVDKGCEHNYQCSFEEECDKATGACIPMTRDHCGTCDPDAQTPQCGGDPNMCVTLQAENPETGQAEEKGDFCFLTCEDDPIDQCPQGYQCQAIEIQDQQAGTTEERFLCIRACYESPLGAPQ